MAWYMYLLLNHIHIMTPICCFQLYVKGCVELLKHVHTSWSEAVEELVQNCLHVDHPVVSVLEKQYHLLQLKKLLRGYGVRDFNFSDMSKGWVRSV